MVQDLGANDLLMVPSTRDASMTRPRPLQLVAVPARIVTCCMRGAAM